MKVLHVTPSYYPAYTYGGPTRSVHGLVQALARGGADVRVLTTNANGLRHTLDVDTSHDLLLRERLSVRYAPRIAPHAVSPKLAAALPSAVRWADVVHLTAVYNFPTLPTLAVARHTKQPLVWSPRGGLQRWADTRRQAAKSLWERLCRNILPERTLMHATSNNEADQIAERLPGVRCTVIPNGVDVPEPVSHVPSNTYRVLFLGRLDPIKGLENLLGACAQLRDDVELVVAGAGTPSYERRLRECVGELGIGSRVRFLGNVAEERKPDLFSRSDVLVLPSHSENFGLAAAEALAHGVPVVASTGTPWQVLDRESLGRWVENSPESLARALDELRLCDRLAMGERGRHWVSRELGWGVIAHRMLDAYEKLLLASRTSQ